MSGGSIRDTVAKNIKFYRTQKGLSQEKLSKACGLSIRFISRAENSTQNLTLETLQTIAKALDVTVADLADAGGGQKLPKATKKTADAIDYVVKLLQAYRGILEKDM